MSGRKEGNEGGRERGREGGREGGVSEVVRERWNSDFNIREARSRVLHFASGTH